MHSNTKTTYLRPLEREVLGDVSVQEAVEDDGQAQDEVEARVHPGLVQGRARHRREVTAVAW